MSCCFPFSVRHLFPLGALLVATSGSLFAQTEEWIRGVGGPGTEYGRFVEPTADGGFAVAGTKSPSAGSSVEDFWIARFDSAGTLLWEKTYGKDGVPHTIFTFSSTTDGGFMVGGFTGQQFSGTESAIMFRVDSAGTLLWEYDVDYNSSDHWHLLVERREGGYYFGGHTDSKGDAYGDMWLVRLDAERNVVWERTFDRGTGEHAHAGIQTSDGGVIMLGHTEESNLEKYWLVKVDSNGTLEWDKVLSSGPAGHDSPYDIFETAEGNYALVGGTSGTPSPSSSRGWLLIVDSVGNTVVDEHFGNTAGSSFTWGGRQTRDGGFILAGHSNYRSKGLFDMYIVKTDALGDLEWESTYGGTSYDYGFDIVEVDDGFIAVGLTRSFPIVVGGEDDLLLVKIREEVVLPEPVVLRAPANHSSTVLSPVLLWTSTPEATRYHVQLATDAAFASLELVDSTLTGTAISVGPLAAGTRYWWRVQASNENGWGPFSDAWDFTTASPSLAGDAGLAARNAIAVAPNPTAEDVVVALEVATPGMIELALFDARGEHVASIAHELVGSGRHVRAIDARGIPSGAYILRLSRAGEVLASTRVVVAH